MATEEIEKYRRLLPVNKHRLDDELEIQPEYMDRISAATVRANTRQLELKDELARVESRLANEFKEDDAKLSIPAIEGKVKRAADRMKVFERWMAARADYEDWTGLLSAWKDKGYSLKTLTELYVANYFSVNSTGASPRTSSRLTEQESRNMMREASRLASHEHRGGSAGNTTTGPDTRTRRRVDD